MKKGVLITSLTAFIFTLPAILSCFVDVSIINGFHYYMIYFFVTGITFCVSFICALLILILRKMRILKVILTYSFTVFIVLLLMFFLNIAINKLILNDLPHGSNYLKFNSIKWKQHDKTASMIRQYMIKDLLRNVLPGKNKIEIEKILGVPEKTDNNKFEYIIGPERGYFGIDIETLHIYFDNKEIFESYKISSD